MNLKLSSLSEIINDERELKLTQQAKQDKKSKNLTSKENNSNVKNFDKESVFYSNSKR